MDMIYGQNVFSVREPMWHGKGKIFTDYPGREEAMKAAGHDFEVLRQPLFIAVEEVGVSPLAYRKLGQWTALKHSKDDHILSVVKSSYEVIQNDQLWDILDMLVNQPNVRYETAGTLKEGALLWAMARLDEPLTVKGDDTPTYPYVTVSTSHDQSSAARAIANAVRVVCFNTFSAADAQAKADGLYFTFRHTKNVKEKIEAAREALGMVRDSFKRYHELTEALAEKVLTFENIKDLVSEFLPMPPEAITTDKVKTNVNVARSQVLSLVNGEAGTVPQAHVRTGYGLWCAEIEYLDHIRAFRSTDTYFKRSILDPASIKLSLANSILKV